MAFSDDLSTYPLDQPFTDGDRFGHWGVVFAGGGSVTVVERDDHRAIKLEPAKEDSENPTRSTLVFGPTFQGAYELNLYLTTESQLRSPADPNPWEMAWVFWNASDHQHAYYFIGKTNGWELGKLDPAGKGGQVFLDSGNTPVFTVGQRYLLNVKVQGGRMMVSADGELLSDTTDDKAPYVSGRLGLYVEDASVVFDGISAASAELP